MADPTKYERDYSFTDYQASNPSAPLPGIQVDNELENVETSLGQAIDAIKDVRRSDGALKNGIVTVDSLDATVAAGVGAGALASAEAAAASADAASDSAVAAAASASAAGISETAASGYASNALTSRNEASGFSDDSAAAATLSQTARDFANQWAVAAFDTNVNDGVNPVGKSAFHWAQVALAASTATIPDGSVTTAKIADGALSADTTGRAKMADGFVTSAKIADGTITTGDIADSAITSAKIADGTIATADLADGAVTSAKIADGTITTGDLADSAVTKAKLAATAVDFVLIETKTISGTPATLDFTGLSSAFDSYELVLRGLVPTTGGQDLWLRVSTDGGSSFLTSSTYNHGRRQLVFGSTSSDVTTNNDTKAVLANNISNDTALAGVRRSINFVIPATGRGSAGWDLVAHTGASEYSARGDVSFAAGVNAIRLLWSGTNTFQNVNSVSLYGKRK